MKIKYNITLFFAFILGFVVFSSPAPAGEGAEPIPTYRYMMVYGTGNLEEGDVIEFFTPAGVICGRFVVEEAGAYGLLSVYGDDSATDRVEGARPGEELTVRVNGIEVQPRRGSPVWRENLEPLRVDL